MSQSPSAEDVCSALIAALQQLYLLDSHLIHADANERSITHRLAVYLEQQPRFHGWHIDCEYNRNQGDIKRLTRRKAASVSSDELDAQTVYPDIIVHKRGSDINLLVIEAKKSNAASSDEDIKKLRAFQQQSHLRYRYAYAIRFDQTRPELIRVEMNKRAIVTLPEDWLGGLVQCSPAAEQGEPKPARMNEEKAAFKAKNKVGYCEICDTVEQELLCKYDDPQALRETVAKRTQGLVKVREQGNATR